MAFVRRNATILAEADLVHTGSSPLLLVAIGALLIGVGLSFLLVRKS